MKLHSFQLNKLISRLIFIISIVINICFIQIQIKNKLDNMFDITFKHIKYDDKKVREHPYNWVWRWSLASDFDIAKMYTDGRDEWSILALEIPTRYDIFESLAEDDIRLKHYHQAATAFTKCIHDMKHDHYKLPQSKKLILRDYPNIEDNTKLSNICNEYIFAGFISKSDPMTSQMLFHLVINSKYGSAFLNPAFRKFP